MKELLERYHCMKEYIKQMKNVAVAYSAGVDSTFLLYAAKEALQDDVTAYTASLYSVPQKEMDEAVWFCDEQSIKHIIVKMNELEIAGFSKNPKNRCYLCKREIFRKMKALADEQGAYELLEGSNADDRCDERPGMIAIRELKIKSPLLEYGFTKEEIRKLSKHLGLATWDKPAYACLSSRIPYGETITITKLQMIEKAESCLHKLGFRQVRVRMHTNIARIELEPGQMEKFWEKEIRERVKEELKDIGFKYVTVDLTGFESGNLNRV
nr:ATP-dependent sacrificial sulfur transferase LarE [Eubacterium oxidoreducens]